MDMREIRIELIQSLLQHSKGTISERQASDLADSYLRQHYIYEGSLLTHVGLHNLAKQILFSLRLI